jgi:transposase
VTHAAPTPPDLPTDAATLRALVLAMMAERDRTVAERDAIAVERDALAAAREQLQAAHDALADRAARLEHLLRTLRRLHYGAKSERLPEAQLQLGLEDTEAAIAKVEAEAERDDPALRRERAAKRRANRGKLPAHLPRIEVELAPDDTACPCCRAAMVVIGEDRSERLDVIPAQFRVLVTRRPKLACRACAGVVVQEAAPSRLVEGGIPTEATVAHVLVARYADHLPLYRQAQIWTRQGVSIDRSTLASWVGTAAAELAPVVARLKEIVLGSARIFADETPVPVLDPGRGRTKKGYFWAIARDDRPWGGKDPPAVVYTYAPGRGHKHGLALLGDFRGILQVDGYPAYQKLADPAGKAGPSALAFCWSHVRRGFYDVAKGGNAPIATEALARIAALYRIEAEIRGLSADERLAHRQARSAALVADLRIWFEAQHKKLFMRGPTAEAIGYALNHWDGLVRFLCDGRVEIDSNTVERSMRPVALSRKNALFAGSDDGAENWAIVASLVETCKLNAIDPQRYLAETLTRLVNGWRQSRIDELMPWAPATQ